MCGNSYMMQLVEEVSFAKEWKISRNHGLPKAPLFSLLYFLKILLAVPLQSGILIPGDQDHTPAPSAVEVQSLTHWTAKRSPFSSIFKEVPCVLIILGYDPLFSAHVASTFRMKLTFQHLSWKRKESSHCNTSMAWKQPPLPPMACCCFRKALLFISCLHTSCPAGCGVSLLLRVLQLGSRVYAIFIMYHITWEMFKQDIEKTCVAIAAKLYQSPMILGVIMDLTTTAHTLGQKTIHCNGGLLLCSMTQGYLHLFQ